MSTAHGFVERYDAWTGRAWVDVLGPEPRQIPIDGRYGSVRAALRERFPDRPFTSEWATGRFPASPLGLPLNPVLLAAWATAVSGCIVAGALGGPVAAGAMGVAFAWPLLRLLDGIVVSRRGIRAGPPWAGCVAWHDVDRVTVRRGGRGVQVWVWSANGATSGTVPRALVPALRARVRRLGGVSMTDEPGGLDLSYAAWQPALNGAPWGLLLGTSVAALATPWPFELLIAGWLATAGVALLAAAVQARATGWGTGSVMWLTMLYAVVLVALSLGFQSLGQPLP